MAQYKSIAKYYVLAYYNDFKVSVFAQNIKQFADLGILFLDLGILFLDLGILFLDPFLQQIYLGAKHIRTVRTIASHINSERISDNIVIASYIIFGIFLARIDRFVIKKYSNNLAFDSVGYVFLLR